MSIWVGAVASLGFSRYDVMGVCWGAVSDLPNPSEIGKDVRRGRRGMVALWGALRPLWVAHYPLRKGKGLKGGAGVHRQVPWVRGEPVVCHPEPPVGGIGEGEEEGSCFVFRASW